MQINYKGRTYDVFYNCAQDIFELHHEDGERLILRMEDAELYYNE